MGLLTGWNDRKRAKFGKQGQRVFEQTAVARWGVIPPVNSVYSVGASALGRGGISGLGRDTYQCFHSTCFADTRDRSVIRAPRRCKQSIKSVFRYAQFYLVRSRVMLDA